MGELKDLRKKKEDGELTDEEKKKLEELEQDIEESKPVEVNEPDDEEKAIEELSNKLASRFQEKIAPLTELADRLEKQGQPIVETKESKFIVDPQMGKISVDKLDEVKVEVPGRKSAGKQFHEVSKKTIHFIQAMMSNDRQKLQTLVEGTGASGGFLVPEDFVNILIEDRRDLGVMRQLATVLNVSTDTIHIPTLGSRPKAFWRAEAAVKSTTTVTFGEVVLTPYSLAAIVPMSNELVADAALGGDIVSIVSRVLSKALAEEEENAFWTGDGTGEPTGINTYTYRTVAAGAGASDSARADAIIRSLYTLDQGYRGSAAFVANRNTWSRVATIKDSQNNYLLSGLGDAATPTLRGRATYEVNDLEDGVMFLGDFSYYYIADRQGIQVDTSTEATVASQSAFERNLTFVRAEERVDGEMTLTDAVVEITGLGGL